MSGFGAVIGEAFERAEAFEAAVESVQALAVACPRRIQRKRSKGWRMPVGAVYVGRPSKYANPFRLRKSRVVHRFSGSTQLYRVEAPKGYKGLTRALSFDLYPEQAHSVVTALFRTYLDETPELDLEPLRGRDLACWCPPGLACHAGVLLSRANRPAS